MINYSIHAVEVKKPESITCDVCHSSYYHDSDWEEIQEFQRIDFIGGYGSIFGDGNHMAADICQKCLKNLLGASLMSLNEVYEDEPEDV